MLKVLRASLLALASLSLLLQCKILRLELGVPLSSLTLSLLDALHDFGQLGFFNSNFSITCINLLPVCLGERAVGDLTQLWSVPVVALSALRSIILFSWVFSDGRLTWAPLSAWL